MTFDPKCLFVHKDDYEDDIKEASAFSFKLGIGTGIGFCVILALLYTLFN